MKNWECVKICQWRWRNRPDLSEIRLIWSGTSFKFCRQSFISAGWGGKTWKVFGLTKLFLDRKRVWWDELAFPTLMDWNFQLVCWENDATGKSIALSDAKPCSFYEGGFNYFHLGGKCLWTDAFKASSIESWNIVGYWDQCTQWYITRFLLLIFWGDSLILFNLSLDQWVTYVIHNGPVDCSE